ncbi:T9SS type A sorting domain-containing protein [Fluviicola sp.]|uniref:T9SS type A sorting domain-containing protein n=1 Tax=Fluviicola sp. TaxID=1917219 RepID=UPI0031D57FA3
MKNVKLLLLTWCFLPLSHAQNDCDSRTFITNTSLDQSGFMVMTYSTDELDSLHWNFGDGTTSTQLNPGTGSGNHQYASPGIYTVTLEQWGKANGVPFHCIYSAPNEIYDYTTDSLCGGDFLTHINGNTVTFSNTSLIHSPSFSSHSSELLWDFGNGSHGIYLNRLYDVSYNPGTYTACLYYAGFSFNDGGYMYDCSTCKTFTIGTAGLDSPGNRIVNLFPNPATHALTIPDAQDIDQIEVYSVTGEKQNIQWRTGENGSIRVSVESLESGLYFLYTSGNNITGRTSFVKE